jgi:hypothetical protein
LHVSLWIRYLKPPGESYSGIRALAIYLCALKYTNKLSGAIAKDRLKTLFLVAMLRNVNKLSGAIARETVAELAMNLAYPCTILFYLLIRSFFSFLFSYEFHSYLSIC